VVDYLICNAVYNSSKTRFSKLNDFENDPSFLNEDLELSFRINAVGLVNSISAFMPLVRASTMRKIIALTSANGVCSFINESGLETGVAYATSKAAVNLLVAKYDATYKSEGILIMGICAGAVNTREGQDNQPGE
jgi:NAD(P)-dependent dehydrogenase (short-subunit alcohol dehydrogenase family)